MRTPSPLFLLKLILITPLVISIVHDHPHICDDVIVWIQTSFAALAAKTIQIFASKMQRASRPNALLTVSIDLPLNFLNPLCHTAEALVKWWALAWFMKMKVAFSIHDVRENKCQYYSISLLRHLVLTPQHAPRSSQGSPAGL